MSEQVKAVSVDDLTAEQLEKLLAERKREEAKQREASRQAYEAIREDTVNTLSDKAMEIHQLLVQFKDLAFDELQSVYEVLQEHSKRHQNGKGNFTIDSNDSTKRIAFSYQENGSFDERSKEAEAHIIDFVNRHFEGQEDTQELITKLLERKKGQLDIKLVQKLYSMEDRFDDNAWREGIRLLKESWKPTDTKSYINFYRRDSKNKWESLPLSFSAV